jgi:hypothetical protein
MQAIFKDKFFQADTLIYVTVSNAFLRNGKEFFTRKTGVNGDGTLLRSEAVACGEMNLRDRVTSPFTLGFQVHFQKLKKHFPIRWKAPMPPKCIKYPRAC